MLDYGFYNMDCMEGMKQFPDKYFDLAIVDPPYGINADSFGMGDGINGRGRSVARILKKERKNGSWDIEKPSGEYFAELQRVSKNQIIWGGNYFDLPPSRGVIVWDKMQPWENFSQIEYAWSSFDRPSALFKYRSTTDKGKIHPTQKPVALYEWLINRYAKDGDTILDTHAGSASSLIACHRTGHKYVGFEIDEYYYGMAKKRLEAETAQVNIFNFIGDNNGT